MTAQALASERSSSSRRLAERRLGSIVKSRDPFFQPASLFNVSIISRALSGPCSRGLGSPVTTSQLTYGEGAFVDKGDSDPKQYVLRHLSRTLPLKLST